MKLYCVSVIQILACLRGLVKDSDNNVSRAAVLALSSIIKGMGPKLFQVSATRNAHILYWISDYISEKQCWTKTAK